MNPDNDPIVLGCRELSKRVGAKSLAEIAQASGVTPSAIYQVERKAMKRFFKLWTIKYGRGGVGCGNIYVSRGIS